MDILLELNIMNFTNTFMTEIHQISELGTNPGHEMRYEGSYAVRTFEIYYGLIYTIEEEAYWHDRGGRVEQTNV